MPKLTVLVIGGAGYIGSEVNYLLNKSGYNTVVFDNLSRGNRAAVFEGIFFQGDIKDSEALQKVFSLYPIDAVMHFAALTDVGESMIDPLKYYQNNLAYSLNLIQEAVKNRVKAFIFSSSAAVYGIPETRLLSEDHPCHPINPYGSTKLMVEKILSDSSQAYGLPYISLRYFNAAGGDPEGKIPLKRSSENNLIPLVLKKILQNNLSATIYGDDYPTKDGTCIRDYIHIYDLAAAHILAMEHLLKTRESDVFNLGNGQGFSVKEVLNAIEAETKQNLQIIQGPRRAGDPAILVANADKARIKLGWSPIYPSINTMVKDTWNAMQPALRINAMEA